MSVSNMTVSGVSVTYVGVIVSDVSGVSVSDEWCE